MKQMCRANATVYWLFKLICISTIFIAVCRMPSSGYPTFHHEAVSYFWISQVHTAPLAAKQQSHRQQESCMQHDQLLHTYWCKQGNCDMFCLHAVFPYTLC